MSPVDLPLSATTSPEAIVSNLLTVVIAVFGIIAVLILWALVQLFRRREGAKPTAAAGLESLRDRANVQLVRADDAVRDADDELAFAIAQFGHERTADFSAALASARVQLTAAFRLKHELDDAFVESAQKQRETALQIVALSEAITERLEKHRAGFTTLRGAEAEAPERLAGVRRDIRALEERVPETERTIAELRERFAPQLVSTLESTGADVATLIAEATAEADAAEAAVAPSGVNSVGSILGRAEAAIARAISRLDSVQRRARELDAASDSLDAVLGGVAADLTEAREQRDSAPGPDEADRITRAIAAVEAAVAGVDSSNPPEALDRVGEAISQLDAALATARSQQQRLEHASLALSSALSSATTQLSEVAAFVAVGGRRVGADARARLALAERELEQATAPGAEPVEALDAARRAITHVRDADAIARYDAQRG